MVSLRISFIIASLALVSAAPAPADDVLSPRDNGMILRYKLHGCGSKGEVPGHCWDCKCGPGADLRCGDECKAAGCGCIMA